MTAPIASGWSESPGGACTHWKPPPFHGARGLRTFAATRSGDKGAPIGSPEFLLPRAGPRRDPSRKTVGEWRIKADDPVRNPDPDHRSAASARVSRRRSRCVCWDAGEPGGGALSGHGAPVCPSRRLADDGRVPRPMGATRLWCVGLRSRAARLSAASAFSIRSTGRNRRSSIRSTNPFGAKASRLKRRGRRATGCSSTFLCRRLRALFGPTISHRNASRSDSERFTSGHSSRVAPRLSVGSTTGPGKPLATRRAGKPSES